MSAVALPLRPRAADPDQSWDVVLRWLIFTGVCVFAAAVLWRYGLVRLMVVSDRTHISSLIAVLYVGASLHCLARAVAVAREGADLARFDRTWTPGAPEDAIAAVASLRRGAVRGHLEALERKARQQGGGRLDQTLLLHAFAHQLRRGHQLGALAGDSMMKLGLLGTIVGFILMLGPVRTLSGEDATALRGAMSVMSEGMAVAMYTTLAGLLGSLLLKAQHVMLESAAAATFLDVVRFTETRVVPVLESRRAG